MERLKNYLLFSAVLIIAALVLTLVTDVRRAVADEFKDVRVINPLSMPANVRDVNEARQPVQAAVSCVVDEGSGCLRVIYTVPSGKRLVIEYASMKTKLEDAHISRMTIHTTIGGEEITHYLTPTPPTPLVDTETSVGQELRLYADPGTSVLVSGTPFNSDGSNGFAFTISGYLVDVQ